MKYLAIGLLLCLPALADWQWEGRDEVRRAMTEARRARIETMREVAQARSDARREFYQARSEARREV
jgi:hypothetical protein